MLNPYTPPSAPVDAPPPPPSGPSSIPTTLGVLSIIFGGLISFVTGFWLFLLVVVAWRITDYGARPVGLLVGDGIFVTTSILLVVMGIGLVQRRERARRFTIYWAYAALSEIVAALAVVANVATSRGGLGVGFGIGFGEAIIVSPLLLPFVSYPIVLLALLSRPRVIAAMKR